MKFTALAFLTVAFCVTVQADKHHDGCYNLAHKIDKPLKHFKNKLFDIIDGNPNKQNGHIKKLEEHAGDAIVRIERYIGAGCMVNNQIDIGLGEARAECSQVQSDYARIQQYPNVNPIIKTITESVITECGKIQTGI